MTCHGYVKDGVIELASGFKPPEGAEVVIIVVEKSKPEQEAEKSVPATGEDEAPVIPPFRGERNGVPLLNVPDDAEETTLDLVDRLRDEWL